MSSVSGVRVSGPLAALAPGWGSELVRLGYRPGSAREQLRLMADVSEWLAGRGLQSCDLADARVADLMVERRAAGRLHLLSVRAMVPLLGYLRGLGSRAGAGGVDVVDAGRGAGRAILGVSG